MIERMATEDSPPVGYVDPITAWSVEYVDPRHPEEGSFQVAAFTTEEVAEEFRRRLESDGFFAELRINLIPVHERIEDWEWDR
ncbi:MAG: hypothetical protein ACJ72E_13385 [Marmoricola sp.]